MPGSTARLKLPTMAAGQAQKEVTHNEALTVIDAAMQAVVQAVNAATPPTSPSVGQCWLVGAAPTGLWTGQAGALAAWTEGGWRFVAPFEGMQCWSIADGCMARRTASGWVVGATTTLSVSVGGQQVVGVRQAAIAAPTGGATADIEARAAIVAILAALRTHGLIAA